MWKFMMAKAQQLDLYMKPRIGFEAETRTPYPHNYDPRGWNPFEKDALVLRSFWESLHDYGNLWFRGRIEEGPGAHRYVLSSPREAVLYFSSGTGEEGVRYEPQRVRLAELPLAANEAYVVEVVDPKAGRGVIERRRMPVTTAEATLELPGFTDDIAVHIYLDEANRKETTRAK